MIKNLLPAVRRRSDLPLWETEEHPFFSLQREMNRMFDDIFRGFDVTSPAGRSFGTFSPSVDVREDDKEVTVKAELPGMEEKDIDVSLTGDGLTIKGEKKDEKEEKGKGYWHRETSYGDFQRFIPLPEGLNTEKVDARFRNGVLTVTLPRLKEAKAKGKKVAIKAE
ncbi:MAG: Hsp20/alpha crystallin family protein [Deltaproteobacteria bacterium]|nr:Hsp20/alpha crystallin family protein [Deltaproteobacteria bacterium]